MNCKLSIFFIYLVDEMIRESSSMTTTQSFILVASSSNIKCSFCLCEQCKQQHDYFISRVKKLTDIFKEMSHNIDVQRSKKTSWTLSLSRFIHLGRELYKTKCI